MQVTLLLTQNNIIMNKFPTITDADINSIIADFKSASKSDCNATKKAVMVKVAEVIRNSHTAPITRSQFVALAQLTNISEYATPENGVMYAKNQHQTVATHGSIDNVDVIVKIPGAFGGVRVDGVQGIAIQA